MYLFYFSLIKKGELTINVYYSSKTLDSFAINISNRIRFPLKQRAQQFKWNVLNSEIEVNWKTSILDCTLKGFGTGMTDAAY